MLTIQIITLISIFAVVYHHALWPLLLKYLSKNKQLKLLESDTRGFRYRTIDSKLPFITLIIPVCNEEDFIEAKLWNLSIIDYPRSRFEAHVIFDGCTDKTLEIAENFIETYGDELPRTKFTVHAENKGKLKAINEAITIAKHSEIIALSDCSSLLSTDSMLIMAEHMQANDIGVVCGGYKMLESGHAGEASYLRYQEQIKSLESALGSVMGAHGAFYGFKRELFVELEQNTINDDFLLPMQIVAQGYRAVYAPNITALELEKTNDNMNWKRRLRISGGNLQQALKLTALLSPRFGYISLCFFSGKFLRAFMPFFMVFALVGSFMAATGSLFFGTLCAIQCIGYGIALMGKLMKNAPKPVRIITYLVSGHLAGLIGGICYLTGQTTNTWRKV